MVKSASLLPQAWFFKSSSFGIQREVELHFPCGSFWLRLLSPECLCPFPWEMPQNEAFGVIKLLINSSLLELLLSLFLSKPESSLGTVLVLLVSQTEMVPSKWPCTWSV